MKLKINWESIDKKWKTYTLSGILCILAYLLLINLGKFFSWVGVVIAAFNTVFIGAVIAYILNPLAKFCEKKIFHRVKKERSRWNLSVVLTFVLTFAFLTVPFALIVPQLVKSVGGFIENFNTYAANLTELTKGFDPRIQEIVNPALESLTMEGGVLSSLAATIGENFSGVTDATASVSGSAINWVIGTILSVYFLLNKPVIVGAFRKFFAVFFSPNQYTRFSGLTAKFHDIFSRYIVFELLDALIIGVMNALFMAFAGIPNVALISVIAALTNLIPTFGPIIGAGISGVMLLLAAPGGVIPFLIFTVVSQACDAYIIKPKLFGNALNVPGVLILVAVVVFGKLMGIAGMLLAIPLAGILTYMYSELLLPWLAVKHEKEKAGEAEDRRNKAQTEARPLEVTFKK